MKIFLLGLDGSTLDLIGPWASEGKLPTIKKLIRSGSSGRLRSTIKPITPVAWTSIMTGKNPGKHNMMDFFDADYENFRIGHFKAAGDVKAEFVWEILEKNGIKCGIINIPMSSPFRSRVTFGEGDHLRKDWMNFSWPEDTKAGLNPSNPLFERRMFELIDMRFDQIDYIAKNKEWDFLAMNIFAVDPLQHYRWYDMKLLLRAFKKVDARLSEVLERLGEINLFLISDHGMTRLKKTFHMDNWLQSEGYLRFRGGGGVKASRIAKIGLTPANFTRVLNPLISFAQNHGMMRFIPSGIRKGIESVKRKLPSADKLNIEQLSDRIDWSSTRAYCMGSYGDVVINLRERSSHGIVEGGEYSELRDEIREKLKDYFRGLGIKSNIWKREELYSGPYMDNAPDLLFYIDDGHIITESTYKIEDSASFFTEPVRGKTFVAHHALNGIFIAHGQDIAEGKEIENLSIMDITPTILHMFGIPVPEDMDGRVLKEIFRADSEAGRRDVVYQKIDEKGRIKDRVRRLRLK